MCRVPPKRHGHHVQSRHHDDAVRSLNPSNDFFVTTGSGFTNKIGGLFKPKKPQLPKDAINEDAARTKISKWAQPPP